MYEVNCNPIINPMILTPEYTNTNSHNIDPNSMYSKKFTKLKYKVIKLDVLATSLGTDNILYTNYYYFL